MVQIQPRIVKKIAFFGFSETNPGEELYDSVYEAAKYLAGHGYAIVNGGGPGVMEAATKGAQAGGGQTLTVTFDPVDAPGFEGRYVANIPDEEVKTTNYIERMFKLMEHGDFYVVFNGGTGTLSEWATAWVLAKLYKGHHKEFVLYGGFWRPVVKMVEENLLIREEEKDLFSVVENKEEILEAIVRFEKKMERLDHEHCKVCKERAFMT
jgi:hypothetical protein